MRIGVISDTHGYLDPRVLEIFAGVDHVIHAGDILDAEILSALAQVAPLTAVCGNVDYGVIANELPTEVVRRVGDVTFVVAHKPKRLLKRLAAGKIDVGIESGKPDLVVWGHVHTPTAVWVEGSLHLNPGTATSPYEEDDDPTIAIVESGLRGLSVCFVPLERRKPSDSSWRQAFREERLGDLPTVQGNQSEHGATAARITPNTVVAC